VRISTIGPWLEPLVPEDHRRKWDILVTRTTGYGCALTDEQGQPLAAFGISAVFNGIDSAIGELWGFSIAGACIGPQVVKHATNIFKEWIDENRFKWSRIHALVPTSRDYCNGKFLLRLGLEYEATLRKLFRGEDVRIYWKELENV
jgi:hypothetical protein